MRYFVLALVLCSACGKKRAGSEFFGTSVVPPGSLAKFHPGMTLEQLQAVEPEIRESPGHGYVVPSSAKNIELHVMLLPEPGETSDYSWARIEGTDGLAMLTAAWGPPDKDLIDPDEVVWRSQATGWRANLRCWPDHGEVHARCDLKFLPYKPLTELFVAKVVKPPDAYGKLRMGMTPAEVTATLGITLSARGSRYTNLSYDNVRAEVMILDDRLFELTMTLPMQARPMLLDKWGAGLPTTGTPNELTWIDPATGWRATLRAPEVNDRELRLQFANYVPVVKLLEDLLAKPLLGSSKAAIKKSQPELFSHAQLDFLQLPPTEWTTPAWASMGRTPVDMIERDGKVEELVMVFTPSQMFEGASAAILAAFEARWGKPKRGKGDGSLKIPTRRYGDHIDIDEDEKRGSLLVRLF